MEYFKLQAKALEKRILEYEKAYVDENFISPRLSLMAKVKRDYAVDQLADLMEIIEQSNKMQDNKLEGHNCRLTGKLCIGVSFNPTSVVCQKCETANK